MLSQSDGMEINVIGYDKILRDSIKDEKKGIDYNYTSNDKIIFKKMLKGINELTHRRFRYLALEN